MVQFFQAGGTEAEKIFPLPGRAGEPESSFLSSQYPDSYQLPYNPDPLAPGNDYTIYDKMRHDDQVKAALEVKKDMVINAGWKIECDDEGIRDELTDNLRNGMEESIDAVLRDVLSAYDYGFSISEPVYELRDGSYRWKAVKTRPPHSFRFEVDPKGNVTEIVQSTSSSGDVKYKPGYFLHHIYQPEFGNPYGRSDLRAAHDAWKAKVFIFRFMAIYLERFAGPLVVGKYKSSMSSSEVTRFQNMLKTIQNATSMVIPEDAIVDIVQNARDSTDAYVKAIDLCNMMIARSILVPDLMGLGGSETSGGSYALGQTQFKIFLGSIDKDRKFLSRNINMKLIRPLVEANYGEDMHCEFEFLPFSEEDEFRFSELWIKAVQGRVFKPNEDEVNHLRAQLRFPQGDVQFFEEGARQVPGGSFSVDSTPRRYVLPRDLTQWERNKRMDYSAIESVLDQNERKAVPRLNAAARKIISEFARQVVDRGIIARARPEELSQIQPSGLRDMNEAFRENFTGLFRKSYDQARRELLPAGDRKMQEGDPWLPDEFLDYLRSESFKLTGDFSRDVFKRMGNVVSRGIRDGLPASEIVKLARGEGEDFAENWVTTVVRTRTTEVYNQARKSFWESDELAKDIVVGYQYSAILDNRTTRVCEFMDGKSFEVGEFTDRVTPPLHFNCRSLWVPITRFEEASFEDPIPLDDLVERGANLIAASEKGRPRRYQGEPMTVRSIRVSNARDTLIIIPPGPQEHIEIIELYASNASRNEDVDIGFRSGADEPLRYPTALAVSRPIFSQAFDPPWALGDALGLYIHLSRSTPVDVTTRYRITGGANA